METGKQTRPNLLRQNFHEAAIPDRYHTLGGPSEETMTEEEVLKKTTGRYETQTVALKRLSNYELQGEQELRTGTSQKGKEIYVSPASDFPHNPQLHS